MVGCIASVCVAAWRPLARTLAAALMLTAGSSPLGGGEPPHLFPVEIPVLSKGDFIIFSATVFQKPASEADARRRIEQLQWIKRFRICLTNGYQNFADKDLQELHGAGCELFLYRWFNGYYQSELLPDDALAESKAYFGQFPSMVKLFREIHAHPEWLLNPDKPIRGGGAEYPAYFYDYASAAFRQFYVASIQRDLDEAQYDGVFFDYMGGWALPAEMKVAWHEKYPDLTYDQAGIEFLKELRAAIGSKRIFGNQAYRLPEGYYHVIDYDASESLATSYVWGKEAELSMEGRGQQKVLDTFYRPWDGPDGYREAARERLAMSIKNPRVRVCDINYLQPWCVPTGEAVEADGQRVPVFTERTDRPALFYSYAISKLVGGCVFASDWYAEGYAEDDVYFLDLGEPLDGQYVETPDAVVRYYKHGFVVVTRSNRRVVFQPDDKYLPAGIADLWDVYEGSRVYGWSSRRAVTLFPAYYPSTGSYYPSGRVYIYPPRHADHHSNTQSAGPTRPIDHTGWFLP
ncbi:MAG: hypothetical protein ACYC6N_25815 [Pirellulaceae bacterium]